MDYPVYKVFAPLAAVSRRQVRYQKWKRGIDLVWACLLLVFAAPALLFIGLLIFVFDGGPVLFTQTRVGRQEVLFQIYKFRTMKLSDETGVSSVTPIGRYLRRWSLDELPQLWNVIRGDMSLVGPRPEVAITYKLYKDKQRRRSSVKPGLTGWWQVNGRPQPLQLHTELDLYYVMHQSLLFDLKILLKTVPAIWRRRC